MTLTQISILSGCRKNYKATVFALREVKIVSNFS